MLWCWDPRTLPRRRLPGAGRVLVAALVAAIAAALLLGGCASSGPSAGIAGQTVVPGNSATAVPTTLTASTTVTNQSAVTVGPGLAPTVEPPTPTPTPPAVAPLDQALAQGWVRGEIRGYDGASGDSVIVSLQRATSQEITVTITQGALLLSTDRDEPNMVVRRLRGRLVEKAKIEPTAQIRLSDDRWQDYVLEAYSLNLDRGKATASGSFSILEVPPTDVAKVLAAADKAPEVTVETLQAAIWAITDGADAPDLRTKGLEPDIDAVRALFEAAGLDPARKRLFDDSQVVSAQQYMARGNSYYEMGEYAQAIADYTKAIELDGSLVDAFYRRGSAAVQVQDYDQAIADFGVVVRLRPSNPLGFYSRGIVENSKADPDCEAAITDLNEAIRLDPGLSDAYHARGLVYAARQDYDRAIEDLTQAIALDPGFFLAYYARGSVYSSKRDLARAITDFSTAIGMVPDFSEAFRARGTAYAGIGDPVLAMQDLQTYLSLEPGAQDREGAEDLIAALQEALPAPAPSGALSLSDALGRGSVKIGMHGLGVASGDSILLTVQRATGEELEIGVPQGLVLVSGVPGESNMIVRRLHGIAVDDRQVQPTGIIRLANDEPQRYFLEAYSLDVNKTDPISSTAFSLGPSVEAETLHVLEAADRMPVAGRDILAIQAAIWAVRSDVTWEELIDRGCQPDLRVVEAILAAAGIDPHSRKLFGGGSLLTPVAPRTYAPTPLVKPGAPPATSALPTSKPTARPTARPAPPAACPNPSVQITSPGDNQAWQGSVTVLGNATHLDFLRYEISFKSAGAPDDDSSWRSLVTQKQPVQNNGRLMEWVTTTVHPNGAYELRLRVVQRSGNYEDCVITVNIRN